MKKAPGVAGRSAGAAWIVLLLKDQKPSVQVGLRRVRDGRYAFGHKRGHVVTAWTVHPFGRVVDLQYTAQNYDGGEVNRFYSERRATLRAALGSGDEWELVLIPDPVPVPLGSVSEKKPRRGGARPGRG